MPGKIVNLYIQMNQKVNPSDPLITIESMKMLNTIYTQEEGIVTQIFIEELQFVEKNTPLLKIKLVPNHG